MNRLEAVLDRPEPTMAVPIGAPLDQDTLLGVSTVADVIEFRADLFPSQDTAYLEDQIRALGALPKLLTIRYAGEGGQWSGSEEERAAAYQGLMPFVDGVDIELAAEILPEVVDAAKDNQKVVVVSSHDFHETPSTDELQKTHRRGKKVAEYTKIAAMANTEAEYQRLADFTLNSSPGRLIVVAMGKYGPLSRITLPGLGSQLTYAFAGDQAVAPGQLSYKETHLLLRQLYPDYAEPFA